MKKILLLFMVLVLASCGPKRMSCYGKRFVELSKKTSFSELKDS